VSFIFKCSCGGFDGDVDGECCELLLKEWADDAGRASSDDAAVSGQFG
jgi:hypothetical protein